MGFISKDVHPGNFCMGLQSASNVRKDTLFMIDFGSAESYIGRKRRVVCNRKAVPCGWYHSKSVSQGMVASRRDDLESLGYMLIYLLKGGLPWYDPTKVEKPPNSAAESLAIKLETSIDDLTRELPVEFAKYFTDI